MVTLKEISKLTGVAESTISRVLNRDPSLSISNHKRRLVVETAESLQYVTRRARNAQSGDRPQDRSVELRQPSELESVVMLHFLSSSEELSRPFYVGMRQGIEARCEAYRLATTRAFVGDFDTASLHRTRNPGVIFVGDPPDRLLSEVAALEIPLVLAHPDRLLDGVDIAYADVEAATARLCTWLVGRGRRRIAFIGIPNALTPRLQGYTRVLKEAGLFDGDYVHFDDSDSDDGESQVIELLNHLEQVHKPVPDVVITHTDSVAAGVYRGVGGRGLSVPADIEVVSINDSSVAQMLDPELTTIRLEAGAIGETAVDLLMERQGGRVACKHVEILPTILPRASTRRT